MKPRERVFSALRFESPDKVPIECHLSPAGLVEHGEKLKELWKQYPQDFNDFTDVKIPTIAASSFDSEGRYHTIERDEWGVEWEYLVSTVRRIPIHRPLDDLHNLKSYNPPSPPSTSGPSFFSERRRVERHRKKYFLKSGWISIFELMHALRRFEDVLIDLALQTDEINQIADMITEYQQGVIRYLLARGVDAIQFGDDFGTQQNLMLSKKMWREFFFPRYKHLMAPIKEAGVKIFFHSCGNVSKLLDDFRELGVDAIWPQLSLYELPSLANRCRQKGLAVALHLRAPLMVTGTPDQVRLRVEEVSDVFNVRQGGAWFYIEIDDGFPFDNIKALFEAITRL